MSAHHLHRVRIQRVPGKISISPWGGVLPCSVLIHGLTILTTKNVNKPIGGRSGQNALYPYRVIVIMIDTVVPVPWVFGP